MELLYDGDTPRWYEHPDLQEKADLAALPLMQRNDVQFYAYDPAMPGPDITVGPAEAVSVVGFPFGLRAGGSFAVWATGFVASDVDIDYNGLPVFLIDCRSRQGQSGSPVIAYRGGGFAASSLGGSIYDGPVFRFLGVYSGRVMPDSDLGMVWKAQAVAQLMTMRCRAKAD